MVLTTLTLNMNGLSSQVKWPKVWSEVPYTSIICFQEIHLQPSDKFSFPLGAQEYDFFYSHGSSNSAGICTAIKCSLNVNPVKSVDVPGQILGVDFMQDNVSYRVLNIYAPTNSTACKAFFSLLSSLFITNTYLLGDFNSVTDKVDWLSGNLDSTSEILQTILLYSGISEPWGSHHQCFTFH